MSESDEQSQVEREGESHMMVTTRLDSNRFSFNSIKCDKIAVFLKKFLSAHALPVCLISGLLFGALCPQPGAWLYQHSAPSIAIFLIFLLSGLKLETSSLLSVIKLWRVIILGTISILFLTPLIAPLFILLPIPRDLGVGMSFFNCMPTTMSSNAIITKESNGNFPLALVYSVITNLVSVFTIPFLLPALAFPTTVGNVSISINTGSLLLSLAINILLPLCAGKLARDYIPKVIHWVKITDSFTKYIGIILLASIPMMDISESSTSGESLFTLINPGSILLVILIAVLAHFGLLFGHAVLIYFACVPIPLPLCLKNIFPNKWARLQIHESTTTQIQTADNRIQNDSPHLPKDESADFKEIVPKISLVSNVGMEECIAFILSGSEKSLGVANAVLVQMPSSLGNVALISISIIVCHFTQIFIDSILSSLWLKRVPWTMWFVYNKEINSNPSQITSGAKSELEPKSVPHLDSIEIVETPVDTDDIPSYTDPNPVHSDLQESHLMSTELYDNQFNSNLK